LRNSEQVSGGTDARMRFLQSLLCVMIASPLFLMAGFITYFLNHFIASFFLAAYDLPPPLITHHP
jgi:UPF0716 family protein affecting phage T7 exclusion